MEVVKIVRIMRIVKIVKTVSVECAIPVPVSPLSLGKATVNIKRA